MYMIFAYNPSQIFLPNHNKIFGSHYMKIDSPSKYEDPRGSLDSKNYYQDFEITRTHWLKLDHTDMRCNPVERGDNTTKCITEYLEANIGCSMGLQGSNPGVRRLVLKLHYHKRIYCTLLLWKNPFRCNTSTEFEAYAMLNHKLYIGNETEIFTLTGCLSSCDAYAYTIQPITSLRASKKDTDSHGLSLTATLNNRFTMKFVIPTGSHEHKEQVEMGLLRLIAARKDCF